MRLINKYNKRAPVDYSAAGSVLTLRGKNELSYDLESMQTSRPIIINIKADQYGYLHDDGLGDRRVMDIRVSPQKTVRAMYSDANQTIPVLTKVRDFDMDQDVELTLWAFGPAPAKE